MERRLADINVTPFIDVLLVLLIIFMVITPVASRGLDVALPLPANDVDTGPLVPLFLHVEPDAYRLNRITLATADDLQRALQDIFATRTDRTLLVQSSGEVSYGRLVTALDVARGAGAERLGLVTARSAMPTPAP